MQYSVAFFVLFRVESLNFCSSRRFENNRMLILYLVNYLSCSENMCCKIMYYYIKMSINQLNEFKIKTNFNKLAHCECLQFHPFPLNCCRRMVRPVVRPCWRLMIPDVR